jgi:hypothetical protein
MLVLEYHNWPDNMTVFLYLNQTVKFGHLIITLFQNVTTCIIFLVVSKNGDHFIFNITLGQVIWYLSKCNLAENFKFECLNILSDGIRRRTVYFLQ